MEESIEVEVIADGDVASSSNLPIFPVIHSKRGKNNLQLLTYYRKKHQGKYRLVKFYRSAYVEEGKNDFTAAISSYMRDIYRMMLHGKISIKHRRADGSPVYYLDDNQLDEKKRMQPHQ